MTDYIFAKKLDDRWKLIKNEKVFAEVFFNPGKARSVHLKTNGLGRIQVKALSALMELPDIASYAFGDRGRITAFEDQHQWNVWKPDVPNTEILNGWDNSDNIYEDD